MTLNSAVADKKSPATKKRSIDEDFELILPQMRAAKGPISIERRRLLVWQAIQGSGKGRAAPQVMVKITSFSSSAQKLAMHLDYISRNGENEVFDKDGNSFSKLAAAYADTHPREAIQLYGREMAEASQIKDKKTGRPRSRVSMNMMLSMPTGTDKTAFELAVGDFLNGQFAAHDYLYAFPDERDHYYARVVVGMRGTDGQWLRARRSDLLQWRQSFASNLQRRGIAASATPSYSRGKPKSNYRRDLAELGKRGTRRVPRPAPTYDPAKEDHTVIINIGATTIVLPLANAANAGRIYILKNVTGGNITIDNYIDGLGAGTTVLTTGITQLQSDGTAWQQIN